MEILMVLFLVLMLVAVTCLVGIGCELEKIGNILKQGEKNG